MKNFNKENFINKINTMDNFGGYIYVLKHLKCGAKDFILDFLNSLEDKNDWFNINLNNKEELKKFDCLDEIIENNVDIDLNYVYNSTNAFSDFINEILEMKTGETELWKIIQNWQRLFYEEIYQLILNLLIEE